MAKVMVVQSSGVVGGFVCEKSELTRNIKINSQKSELKEVQDLGTNEQEESKPIERVLQLNKAAPSRRQVRDRLEELGIYDTRPVVDSISYRLVHNDSVHINDK